MTPAPKIRSFLVSLMFALASSMVAEAQTILGYENVEQYDDRTTGPASTRYQNDFNSWIRLMNDADASFDTTIHDLDLDTTYGPNGFIEDADEWGGNRGGSGSGSNCDDGHGKGTSSRSSTRTITPEQPKEEPKAPAPPKDIPIYGEDLFYERGGAETPIDHSTSDRNYRLRPGDNIKLSIWDGAELDIRRVLTLDADGQVDIPQLGPIDIKSYSIAEAQAKITAAVKEIYHQVQVNVSVDNRRPLRIVVAGHAVRPGVHRLDAGATLLTALDAAGGPSSIGTYRRIAVKRGASVQEADLYDLLNRGDRSWDVELLEGDTVWIPKRGDQIRVAGSVKKQAYYELREPTAIGTVLEWAGLKGSSFTEHVTIERFDQGREHKVITLPESVWDDFQYGEVRDSDRITVGEISTLIRNPVNITGNIDRPGRYQWIEGMRVADLIFLGGVFLEGTDYTRANIKRRLDQAAGFNYGGSNIQTPQEGSLLTINLKAALNGDPKHNIELKPFDELVIYNVRASRPAPMAAISGEVFKPGTFELRQGMRLSDLIHAAGGFKPEANLGSCEIVRRVFLGFDKETAYRPDRIRVNLASMLNGNSAADPILENYDIVRIERVPDFTVKVQIKGDVHSPGEYVLPTGATISDLIGEAGGYLSTAYPRGARFYRESVKVKQEEMKKRFIAEQRAKLSATLANATADTEYKSRRYGLTFRSYQDLLLRLAATPARGRISIELDDPGFASAPTNIPLANGDELVIPNLPSEVSVEGEVFSNTSIVWQPHLSVADYITKAGGIRDGGDNDAIYIFRVDGTSVKTSVRNRRGLFGGVPAERNNVFASLRNQSATNEFGLFSVTQQAGDFKGGNNNAVSKFFSGFKRKKPEVYVKPVQKAPIQATLAKPVYQCAPTPTSQYAQSYQSFARSRFNSGVEPGDIIFIAPEIDMNDRWDLTRGIIDVIFKTAVTAGVITSL